MNEFILEYWLQVVFGIVLTILSFGVRKISSVLYNEIAEQKSIKMGIQAILRDRLIQSYNVHIALGYCEIHNRDNISNMHEQYSTLGADGVIDRLIDEITDLPVKKIEKEPNSELEQ